MLLWTKGSKIDMNLHLFFQYAQSASILKFALWMVPSSHANALKATMMATLEIVLKT